MINLRITDDGRWSMVNHPVPKQTAMVEGPSSMVESCGGEEWNRTINQGLMSPLLYR
jgi:hypothetical protein